MRRRSNGEAIEGAVQATIFVPGSGGLFHPGSFTQFQNYDCKHCKIRYLATVLVISRQQIHRMSHAVHEQLVKHKLNVVNRLMTMSPVFCNV